MEPQIPTIDELLVASKTLAVLDAVIMPDWQYRYYSFNARWADGAQLASMRNGSGDHYVILFTRHGAILKGYDHGSAAGRSAADCGRPPPRMFDGVPAALAEFLNEAAFAADETTFCLWRGSGDRAWRAGPATAAPMDTGGAGKLLDVLLGGPSSYAAWAVEYYERPVDLDAVRSVYRHEPLTAALVRALNPHVTLRALAADAAEIGYPMAGDGDARPLGA